MQIFESCSALLFILWVDWESHSRLAKCTCRCVGMCVFVFTLGLWLMCGPSDEFITWWCYWEVVKYRLVLIGESRHLRVCMWGPLSSPVCFLCVFSSASWLLWHEQLHSAVSIINPLKPWAQINYSSIEIDYISKQYQIRYITVSCHFLQHLLLDSTHTYMLDEWTHQCANTMRGN